MDFENKVLRTSRHLTTKVHNTLPHRCVMTSDYPELETYGENKPQNGNIAIQSRNKIIIKMMRIRDCSLLIRSEPNGIIDFEASNYLVEMT